MRYQVLVGIDDEVLGGDIGLECDVCVGMLVSGEIEVTLLPSCATSFQNVLEVEKAVAEYLKERFPRCSEGIIHDYVILMGKSTAKSNAEYLVINRDFLIQLKVGEGGKGVRRRK